MLERSNASSSLTVERAADILILFANPKTPSLGITEIATALGISKTAVHRIVSSLKNKGLLEIDPVTHRYTLGALIIGFGLSFLNKLDVRQAAEAELVTLSRKTNETATLSIRTGSTRIYVDQITPDREVLMSVQLGIPHPLHAGASSKAFLAFLPRPEIESYVSKPLDKVTPKTVIDPEALMAELAVIKERGWSSSLGERQLGAGSVAAPVLDRLGNPIAVISVCGPLERMAEEIESCVAALLETTGRVALKMGHSPARQSSSIDR